MPSGGARACPLPSAVTDRLQPVYCCAILLDHTGRLVLEQRPEHDADAPGLLTCFGGRREAYEEPLAALRRELLEELGFKLGDARHVLTLHTPVGEAWFYLGEGPEEGTAAAREPGFVARWLAPDAVAPAAISSWHRVALAAWRVGHGVARVTERD